MLCGRGVEMIGRVEGGKEKERGKRGNRETHECEKMRPVAFRVRALAQRQQWRTQS